MINDHVNDSIVQIVVWHRNFNISTGANVGYAVPHRNLNNAIIYMVIDGNCSFLSCNLLQSSTLLYPISLLSGC